MKLATLTAAALMLASSFAFAEGPTPPPAMEPAQVNTDFNDRLTTAVAGLGDLAENQFIELEAGVTSAINEVAQNLQAKIEGQLASDYDLKFSSYGR